MLMAVQGIDAAAAASAVQVMRTGHPAVPEVFQGTIMKQATNFWGEWQCRAFQLNQGRLRYWQEGSDIAKYKPRHEYSLLGAKIKLEKFSQSRFELQLRLAGTRTVTPYVFMAAVFSSVIHDKEHQKHRDDWEAAITAHKAYAAEEVAYQRACAML